MFKTRSQSLITASEKKPKPAHQVISHVSLRPMSAGTDVSSNV